MGTPKRRIALTKDSVGSEIFAEADKFLQAAALNAAQGRAADCLSTRLLRLLGAPFSNHSGELEDLPPNPEHYTQIRKILPAVLSAALVHQGGGTADISALLGALLAQPDSMWEDLSRSESTAYPVAAAVLIYLETFEDGHPADALIAPKVCAMLNTWLRPVIPWLEIPLETSAARAFFGDAWDLFLHRPSSADIICLGDLVLRERPAFLPGLCAEQAPIVPVALPGLD